MASAGVYMIGFLGFILRICLLNTPIPKWLQSNNEVTTPMTSWERVEEGIALQEKSISPYSGDLFHETPLALCIMKSALYFPWKIDGFFIVIDILTMIFMCKTATVFVKYLKEFTQSEKKNYDSKANSLLSSVNKESLAWIPFAVVACYALNPLSIVTLLAKSTAMISNLMTILTMYHMIKGNWFFCTLFLSLAAYQTFYPFVFIVPISLRFLKLSKPKSPSFISFEAVKSYLQTLSLFLVFLSLLLGASYAMEGSWDFLMSTYGFILTVPDLTPNAGVFWYFFTEMFDHFRLFFVCVFQFNAILYTLPLSVKFSDKPIFLMYILIFLTSIFKSYPSYADASLYLSFLPFWKHTFSYMRNTLVVGAMYFCCAVLAPILYHLWIYAGSANANFYFAITLTYTTAQIFLVTDLLYAYLRREYDLFNGIDHRNADGSKAQLILE